MTLAGARSTTNRNPWSRKAPRACRETQAPHGAGASLVGDALVVQSLGNFVFDMEFMPETMEGLVLEATFWDDEFKGVRFVPYRMGADFVPRVVPAADAARLFANFWRFSSLGASPS